MLVGHTRPHDLARCHPATQASDPGLAVVESTAFQPCLRPLVVSATLYAMLLHRCHLCPNSLETGRCSRTFVPTSYGLCDCEDASAHACDSVLEKKARRRVESVCHARKHQSTQLAMAAGMLRGDPGNQYHARFRAKTTIQSLDTPGGFVYAHTRVLQYRYCNTDICADILSQSQVEFCKRAPRLHARRTSDVWVGRAS